VQSREITVAENQDRLDLGEVDLPISKTTSLYGKPAPELEGIIAWQDTKPIALKGLRGKVVVLDFFAYYCSICHEHKPDLMKLRDKYKGDGLVVLALHDSSLKTLDEMNTKMGPVLRRVFHGDPPKLPIALDGAGKQSVFDAYGAYAVPAVILIDQQGRVVRRYHHAGKPELESDVRALLGRLK
jgi:thiol-disulfide isomerase/thioredoxin